MGCSVCRIVRGEWVIWLVWLRVPSWASGDMCLLLLLYVRRLCALSLWVCLGFP